MKFQKIADKSKHSKNSSSNLIQNTITYITTNSTEMARSLSERFKSFVAYATSNKIKTEWKPEKDTRICMDYIKSNKNAGNSKFSKSRRCLVIKKAQFS